MKQQLARILAVVTIAVAGSSAHAASIDGPVQASQATVQALDKTAGKVTLKHGRIHTRTVTMPAMTMTFPIEKPALLTNVSKGDKVIFVVEKVNGTVTVTELKVQK